MLNQRLGLYANNRGISGNALTQKRRLGQSSLAHMQRLFRGEQAVAEHLPRGLHHQVAMVVRRILHQHVGDQVRMVELVHVTVQCAIEDQIAIALCVF